MDDLREIKDKLAHIEKMLKGNGVIGIAEMARRAFDHCQAMKASKNGLYDWAFRVMIMIALTYIAVSVGIAK